MFIEWPARGIPLVAIVYIGMTGTCHLGALTWLGASAGVCGTFSYNAAHVL